MTFYQFDATTGNIIYYNTDAEELSVALGKTLEELALTGVVTPNNIPIMPESTTGKVNVLCGDSTGKMWYAQKAVTYQTDVERIAQLEAQNAQMLLALVNGGLM